MPVIPRQHLIQTTVFAITLFLTGCEQNTTESSSGPTPSISDLSGIWARNSLEFESPPSGPGPLVNLSRLPDGTSGDAQVGDYRNPILQPAAAERVRTLGAMNLAGTVFPDPDNQCWPWPLPYILRQMKIRIHQQPHQVTIIYRHDQQVRRVRMNASHPANVVPSWYGDSVGRYDGDTLVIDTVGIKVGPLSMVDSYGTPYSEALHVVERYHLIDYETAKAAVEGHESKIGSLPPAVSGIAVDLNYRGKGLQIDIAVEDAGVFTTPWKTLVTYRRAATAWPEYICAENLRESDGLERKVPTAAAPDF
jgi:hypothetical protein